MIFQYSPQAQMQPQAQAMPQPGANPYGAQNAFGNQNPEPKKLALPSWLFWLLIIAFLGFAIGLWLWL